MCGSKSIFFELLQLTLEILNLFYSIIYFSDIYKSKSDRLIGICDFVNTIDDVSTY